MCAACLGQFDKQTVRGGWEGRSPPVAVTVHFVSLHTDQFAERWSGHAAGRSPKADLWNSNADQRYSQVTRETVGGRSEQRRGNAAESFPLTG